MGGYVDAPSKLIINPSNIIPGVFGPMYIHGPATANYDEELEPIMLSDWTHETCDAMYSAAQTTGPPTLDNGLINGKNTFNGTGSRYELSFESGKSYRFGIVNSAIDTHFKFAIDGHSFQVIAMDFVPIVPYNTTYLNIAMGEFHAEKLLDSRNSMITFHRSTI